MPQYFTPGVYVEEKPGSPPIVGVGTSTAAFIGTVDSTAQNPGPPPTPFTMPLKPGAPEGSTNANDYFPLTAVLTPQLVTNVEQFKNLFGDVQMGNRTLAHAVFGFFGNGGTRCWVTRVGNLADPVEVGNALKKLEAIDEVAIVAAPGALTTTVQNAVITHCTTLKDRVAIVDGQRTTTMTPAAIRGGLGNEKFAALYFPWLEVFDPVTRAMLFVPPSGHAAGVWARVDAQRGVHKAPANERILGVNGLEYAVTKNEQDGLNPDGINVIRRFNGDIKIWGARTLGGKNNGEHMYLSTRRLMNYLSESIEEGTTFAVFEPNAPPLWEQIKRSVSDFLTLTWRDGALFGNTPEEAFFVRCDETLNPPAVRDIGQVIIEIGVAIVKPAEFVIFRISQQAGRA